MNTYQAQNGFKTFIITLSLSLVVFTAIYYVSSANNDVTGIKDTVTNNAEVTYQSTEESNDDNSETVRSQLKQNLTGSSNYFEEDTSTDEAAVVEELTEDNNNLVSNNVNALETQPIGEVAGIKTETDSSQESPSVFGALANQKMEVVNSNSADVRLSKSQTGNAGQVLSGADTADESTAAVPDTGVNMITGFTASLVIMALGLFFMQNSRKRGIKGFENDVLNEF